MEAVTQLDINLPWVIPMESAECQAVVQLHAAVCHVEGGYRDGVFFSETFPERNIERGVPWQIVPGVLNGRRPVVEPRAVVHICRSERLPGKTCIETQV